jgi:hypothetical protein
MSSLWREPAPPVHADRNVNRGGGVALEVQRGRYTADIDGDFVVFLIGMRFNHLLRIRKWWPVATAMPKMLKVLSQHPELGCLGFQQWFGRTGDVGIWHETFKVRAGEYEAVYGNMPVFGLAAAARHLPAARKANTAAARIGASTTDEPAVQPY